MNRLAGVVQAAVDQVIEIRVVFFDDRRWAADEMHHHAATFVDGAKRLTIEIVSMAGIVAGSAASALATREFRWVGFANTADLARHLSGGLLMGVGGIVALGCTVGQGLSGVSTLSLGSFLALGAIVGGAVLALRYQVWRLERDA